MNEEYEIIKKAKDGDIKSISFLIDKNKKAIYKEAHKYSSTHVEFNDLVSEGILGLMQAIEKFNFEKNTKFLTFARYWIFNYISDYYRKNNKIIKIPDYIINDKSKINKFTNEFIEKNKRNPSEIEISKALNINKERIKKTSSSRNEFLSIDDEVSKYDLYEILKLDINNDNIYVENILSCLTPEERFFLEENSGFFGEKNSYKSLAKKYNKSYRYIKTSIERSKRKLKRQLRKRKNERKLG